MGQTTNSPTLGATDPSGNPSPPSEASSPAITDKWLITDRGVGDLSLDTKVSELVSRGLLGNRPVCGDQIEYTQNDVFDQVYPGIWIDAAFDQPTSAVSAIFVKGPEYRLANGLRIGSTLSELTAIYGDQLGRYNPQHAPIQDIPGIKTSDTTFLLFPMDENRIQAISISISDDYGNPAFPLSSC